MLSLAGSKYTPVSQLVFLSLNGIGVLVATIYNAATPDLYPNNAHHKIGWIITWVVSSHVVFGLTKYVVGLLGNLRRRNNRETGTSTPAHRPLMRNHRWSTDSGQGTEPNSPDSSRNGSVSSYSGLEDVTQKEGDDIAAQDEDSDRGGRVVRRISQTAFSRTLSGLTSYRVWRYTNFSYTVVDRIILPFGFIAFTTGIVTYGRLFVRNSMSEVTPKR